MGFLCCCCCCGGGGGWDVKYAVGSEVDVVNDCLVGRMVVVVVVVVVVGILDLNLSADINKLFDVVSAIARCRTALPPAAALR